MTGKLKSIVLCVLVAVVAVLGALTLWQNWDYTRRVQEAERYKFGFIDSSVVRRVSGRSRRPF